MDRYSYDTVQNLAVKDDRIKKATVDMHIDNNGEFELHVVGCDKNSMSELLGFMKDIMTNLTDLN